MKKKMMFILGIVMTFTTTFVSSTDFGDCESMASKYSDVKKFDSICAKAECLHDLKSVQRALNKMGAEMNEKLADKNPILVAVMNGGMVTLGQLLTRLDFPLQVDYMHVKRYHGDKDSKLEWLSAPKVSFKDRTVCVVDDIIDKGITLFEVVKACKVLGAKEVYTAVLIDKNTKRSPQGLEEADFTGLYIPDKFIIGYGLDYYQYFRNLPGIYVMPVEDR